MVNDSGATMQARTPFSTINAVHTTLCDSARTRKRAKQEDAGNNNGVEEKDNKSVRISFAVLLQK